MGKLKHLIKDQDLFGYTVDLNFNKAGHSHNTLIGGVVSMFLKLFLIFYVVFLFNKMLGYRENLIYHIAKELDLDELGVVNYSTTDFSLVPILVDSRTQEPIDLDDNTRKHITINFNVNKYDIEDGDGLKSFKTPKRTKVETVKCDSTSFSQSEEIKDKYQQLINFKYFPICPKEVDTL